MTTAEYATLLPYILQLEDQGLVRRTFRRLDPERQLAVLNAILEEASQHGPAVINIKRVAGRAGVSVGSLYQYFPDRENMLSFAVELTVRYVRETLAPYRAELAALPLRQALSVYLTYGIEWSRTQAGFLRLFARAAYRGEDALVEPLVRPIATLLREMVYDILVAAQERGELHPGLDLEASARLVHTLLVAAGDGQLLPYLNDYFQLYDQQLTPERQLQALLDLLMNGLTPPGGQHG